MSRLRTAAGKLIEKLGLDWLVMLVGKPAFTEERSGAGLSFSEIRARFEPFQDEKTLDDAIQYCVNLIQREEARADKVESKAFTLIGVTSIVTGFITGFAALLLDRGKIDSFEVMVAIGAIYVLIVFSLIWTIFLARKVVSVLDYAFTYPSAADVFTMADKPIQDYKREHAASLYYSFAQNTRVINRKATYLGGAQLWFRNSIVLLLVLALVLTFHAVGRLSGQSTANPGLMPSPGVVGSPTSIPGLTPTMTVVSPLVSPTAVVTVVATPSLAPAVVPTP